MAENVFFFGNFLIVMSNHNIIIAFSSLCRRYDYLLILVMHREQLNLAKSANDVIMAYVHVTIELKMLYFSLQYT